jgi:hypothetical protein
MTAGNGFDPPTRTLDMYDRGWKVEEYIDWRLSGKHTKVGTRTKINCDSGA